MPLCIIMKCAQDLNLHAYSLTFPLIYNAELKLWRTVKRV